MGDTVWFHIWLRNKVLLRFTPRGLRDPGEMFGLFLKGIWTSLSFKSNILCSWWRGEVAVGIATQPSSCLFVYLEVSSFVALSSMCTRWSLNSWQVCIGWLSLKHPSTHWTDPTEVWLALKRSFVVAVFELATYIKWHYSINSFVLYFVFVLLWGHFPKASNYEKWESK